MNEAWLKIWRSRGGDATQRPTLADLIAINGFDTAKLAVAERDWLENARRVHQSLSIRPGERVFEVGCGAGAFLAGLAAIGPIEPSGIDFSPELIAIVRSYFPQGSFEVLDAAKLPPSPQVDHVIAHSVFQYLDSVTAERVVGSMVRKAQRRVAILDIPDRALQDAAESLRRGNLPPGEYEERYRGLEHSYYDRSTVCSWVAAAAPQAVVSVTQSQIPHNPQSQFRFNVMVHLD